MVCILINPTTKALEQCVGWALNGRKGRGCREDGPNSVTLAFYCLPDQKPLAHEESWKRQKATQLCSLPRLSLNVAAWGSSFSAPRCRLGSSKELALRICLRDLSGKSKNRSSSSCCGIHMKPMSQRSSSAKADGVPALVTHRASTGWSSIRSRIGEGKQSGKQVKRKGNTS